MYYKKLKDIVSSEEAIKQNIDIKFIQKFDKCLKEETNERERLKLNPIKISNVMNVPQKLVMKFFSIGKKFNLFRARAFYLCSCGNYFEIFSLKNIECENNCQIDIEKSRNRIYVVYELLDEVEECDFGDYGEYEIDYISEEDLGGFNGTLNEYDELIGKEEADKLIADYEDEKVNKIKLAHISDLHFGTEHNDGVDNKANLSGIDDIATNIFDSFKTIIKSKDIKYLIISGDLTTKNENKGFEDFDSNMSGINIEEDNIYIVPGNHECDRNEETDKLMFSKFITYTTQYNTPYSKEPYILDELNQIFIYGFNSLNFKREVSKELFYINNSEFKKLEDTLQKLNSNVDNFSDFYKIAVVHNNLIPHPTIELKEFGEMLNVYKIKYTLADLGFSVVCSGHKHQGMIEKHTIYCDNGEQKELVLISAPSLSGNVSNDKNGFQIINIYEDIAKKVKKIEIESYELNKLRKFELSGTVVIDY